MGNYIDEPQWEFFKNVEIGGTFFVWFGIEKFNFVKVGDTTGHCPETDKIEKFAPDCMVRI